MEDSSEKHLELYRIWQSLMQNNNKKQNKREVAMRLGSCCHRKQRALIGVKSSIIMKTQHGDPWILQRTRHFSGYGALGWEFDVPLCLLGEDSACVALGKLNDLKKSSRRVEC